MPFLPFLFGAISLLANRKINQVIHEVRVAVDNLDICSITTIAEVDVAVNLSLSNSGMPSREPAGSVSSTVALVNRRVN